MEQLPIFFQIKDKPVAVAGGGTVAARRAELALRAGAKVRVFAETLSDDFRPIAVHEGFAHIARAVTLEDIRGCALMFSAQGDPAADREAGLSPDRRAFPSMLQTRLSFAISSCRPSWTAIPS